MVAMTNSQSSLAKDVINLIKAVVISEKGGIPVDELRDTYRTVVGEDIPPVIPGYRSLYHLLRDIPEIRFSRNFRNEPILIGTSSKTKHLEELIKYQKPSTVRTVYSRKRRHPVDYPSTIEKQARLNNSANTSFSLNNSFHEKKEVGPILISNSKSNRIFEPILKDRQLVGDDYFLQLCIRYLNYPLERKNNKSAIRCGTVVSGQTVSQYIDTLRRINNMSNKLLICLGTEDIYQRKSVEDIKVDFQEMLDILQNKFGYNQKQITICTLPPLANVPITDKRLKTFFAVNNYIRCGLSSRCQIIDLYNYYTLENSLSTDFDLFQEQARMVSGTPHPYVLWNLKGRQLAMNILTE